MDEAYAKFMNLDEGSSSFFKFKEEQLFDTNNQDMVSDKKREAIHVCTYKNDVDEQKYHAT